MRAVTDVMRRHITADELANTLTHGVGYVLSVFGFVVLLTIAILHGGRWQIVSCVIYGVSLVSLYAASTLYHGTSSPRFKRGLLIFDHCAIYALIAGTYTPFLLVNLKGAWGWSLFAVMWSFAVSGILFKLWFADRYPIFSTTLYLAMGWLGVVGARQIYMHVPSMGLLFLAIGGLLYSIGVVFYVCKKIPHNHVIWHVFVMAASGCHYVAIVFALFLHW